MRLNEFEQRHPELKGVLPKTERLDREHVARELAENATHTLYACAVCLRELEVKDGLLSCPRHGLRYCV